MPRLLVGAIATSIVLWCATLATAADTGPNVLPGERKTMQQSCAGAGQTERDLCVANVKDSAAKRQCDEVMGRAQRRCLLDFLEGKRPVAEPR